MENEKKFRTKTGFCHISPDRIVLTRDGVVGDFSKITVGNTIYRILIIYSGLALALFYFAFKSYQEGNRLMPILFTFLGLSLFYGVFTSKNNSATPIIERSKIKGIKFKKAFRGITRSRFEIMFEDDHGKLKKRLILLPGALSNGQNETEKAIKIMQEEQLLVI